MAIVTFEFGILIRKGALAEKNLSRQTLLEAMEVETPYDEDQIFYAFGPHFGKPALAIMSARLTALGLEFWDDFFEAVLDHPSWCSFIATAPTRPRD